MKKGFKDMLEQVPNELRNEGELKKKNKGRFFGDVQVIIKIAQWRAREIIQKQKDEDIKMDASINLRDMLSRLKLENGLLFDIHEEQETIDHYKNPRRLSDTFRSKAIDALLDIEISRAQLQYEDSYTFRRLLFPYLPPYDTNS